MQKPNFVDLFSGCGGFSLGLVQAGWEGRFAIERSDEAFSTFKKNFLDGPDWARFKWPTWLPRDAQDISEFLRSNEVNLRKLRGSIDLVAGGPPCQGFSYAGKRKKTDPRNKLFKKYVSFVELVQPKFIVLENVPGMRVPHGAGNRRGKKLRGRKPQSYLDRLLLALDGIGYETDVLTLDASTFGVPQRRPRLIVVGVLRKIALKLKDGAAELASAIEAARVQQLDELGLGEVVTAGDAISDLEIGGNPLLPCTDTASPKGFLVPSYMGPRTNFQQLMHQGICGEINSTRLAKHRDHVIERFTKIVTEARKGVQLHQRERKKLGMLKRRTIPMARDQPAPTVTTLPDDILHYDEPRILSVRESARLQSFPDWFEFLGNYTTGGERRRSACPRYTQVGNAVPPLLARAIGVGVRNVLNAIQAEQNSRAEKLVADFDRAKEISAVI